MSLVLKYAEGPFFREGDHSVGPSDAIQRSITSPEDIRIALVNMMPDLALEETEVQFSELLSAASGGLRVTLEPVCLPHLPRSEQSRQRLSRLYFKTDDLWNSRFDAVIVTGTEPRQPDLRQEPYWPALTEVLDWAEGHTSSTILSCLAAHAGVLHSDGIERHLLSDKQFGVFEFCRTTDHVLTERAGNVFSLPHSRWNEVPAGALSSCGYNILTQSEEAGVDLFVKKKRKSLFVHFQGHPEYGKSTLLKEYRRDIRGYLTNRRENYPSMPAGYFDAAATRALNDFRARALANRTGSLMEDFPAALVAGSLQHSWQRLATCVYRNWLQYLAARRADTPRLAAIGRARSASANWEIG